MLPQSHIAYTWLALSVVQDLFGVAKDADYRLVALAATSPDLIDKPLAATYFYRKYKSAVLFAHTLLVDLALIWVTAARLPQFWVYATAFLGHAILDRLWLFPSTFDRPLRGWRFHVWGKQGSEQPAIGRAYWVAFSRRKELWGWELGGIVALGIFVGRQRLYRWESLKRFVLTGRVDSRS